MSEPSTRSELLPLIGQRASVEIAALVIPLVVIVSAPAGTSSLLAWCWAALYGVAALGVVIARRRFRSDLATLDGAAFEARWAQPLERTALLFGTIWGLLPWTGAAGASVEFALFLYLVLAGTTASTVTFAAADLRVFARYLLPAWTLASLAVPFAFPTLWMAVLPLCGLYPWLVWRHARSSHGFFLQQSTLQRQSLALAQAHKEARDLAAAASREKSLFLATASHDLRQPLYALTLTAQAALQRNRDASLAPLLVDIAQAAGHVNELLNSLLDVSALDSRRADLALQPMALTPLLSELHERFQPEAQARGLAWRIRGPEAPAWVVAEPMLLRRALSNLLHNALRYTPRGGVLLAVRRRGEGWAIEVWDTGVGVAAPQREGLFAEFHRGDNAAQVTGEGQGLGLSVVRDCVRRLGGTIDWHSTPGRGSCFRIALPEAKATSTSAPRSRVDDTPFDALRGQVLIIDDDLGVTRGLQHLLGEWGLTCRIAADGAQAHAALSDGFTPDVVMSDLRLRHDDGGYRLMLAILDRAPHARGVVVTGEWDLPDLHRAEAEGYLVLRKPVQPGPLHTVLRSLLADEHRALSRPMTPLSRAVET
ncbi:ATP-binding response regulator [Roseateles amylovorans]|uniref:histidine kinase n=1 Tax=Roseateles amylovorans TaxID=2978473 RepID=A0ABY6B9S8_9BURK|nr:hybrid sensor histidine kinase/response regulator [Roseateles amylovorans]UXH79987.1 ATP-binding protein [Roseateles amylovorans]